MGASASGERRVKKEKKGKNWLSSSLFTRLSPLALALIFGVAALAGWLAWQSSLARGHLLAAEEAVERGHNLEAQRRLERCLAVRSREPRALLLAARVAWRV